MSGAGWRQKVADHLAAAGLPSRLSPRSPNVAGDVLVEVDGQDVVIETKLQKRFSLREWLNDAESDAAFSKARFGAVWMARPEGDPDPADALVLLRGRDFTKILEALSQPRIGRRAPEDPDFELHWEDDEEVSS